MHKAMALINNKKEFFYKFFKGECLDAIGADYVSKSSMTIVLETPHQFYFLIDFSHLPNNELDILEARLCQHSDEKGGLTSLHSIKCEGTITFESRKWRDAMK